MIRLIVNGACGRMGRAVAGAAASGEFEVVAGVDARPSDYPAPVFPSLAEAACEADALIDFSVPEALPEALSYAARRGLPAVLATTGYSRSDVGRIERAARRIPIFRSANMSLGVNLMISLAERSASFLGEACEIEIVEAHHRYKADAPSGTALMIADALNHVYQDGREYVFGRHTRDERRSPSEIGIHALRGGTLAGDHAIHFLMEDETLRIEHSAASRAVYAQGALRAARFLQGRDPGLYNMRDLLLEKTPVTHVRAERRVAMVTLIGLTLGEAGMAEAFGLLGGLRINVDMISASPRTDLMESGVSLSLSEESGAQAVRALNAHFGEGRARLTGHLVKLTVEGLGMERQSGIAAKVFALTGELGVSPHLVTTSPTEISLLIDAKDEFVLAEALTAEFTLR